MTWTMRTWTKQMMTPERDQDVDAQRGTHYADGGVTATDRVYYPDPERMTRINEEWENDNVQA